MVDQKNNQEILLNCAKKLRELSQQLDIQLIELLNSVDKLKKVFENIQEVKIKESKNSLNVNHQAQQTPSHTISSLHKTTNK